MTHKTVGVIGGMGPDATVELMKRVIAATPAQDDADHIHMLVDNNPKVPSRLKALLDGGGENPGPVIAEMAQRLEQAGVDFLVIPCNTAHYYHHYAEEAVQVPVWHLIRMSLHYIAENYPVRRIGLLASSAVQNIELFETFFAEAGLELIYPDQGTQTVIMQVIRAVKAGELTDELLDEYNTRITTLEGIEAFLLGCSELSVIRDRHQQDVPVVDALQVLAEAIVAECS